MGEMEKVERADKEEEKIDSDAHLIQDIQEGAAGPAIIHTQSLNDVEPSPLEVKSFSDSFNWFADSKGKNSNKKTPARIEAEEFAKKAFHRMKKMDPNIQLGENGPIYMTDDVCAQPIVITA